MSSGLILFQKGIVDDVYAADREVVGTLMSGAAFRASYFGTSPAVGDIVYIAPVGDGSWLVITGPSSAAGLFGVGGDGDITITANTATDSATSRTVSCNFNDYTLAITGSGFSQDEVGALVSGVGIRTGTRIRSVSSSSSATLSAYPSADGAGVTVTVYNTSPPRWTKTGSEFALQRDLYARNLILLSDDGAFTLKTNGYRIFVLGTLFVGIGIAVHNDGNAAAAGVGGANAAAGTIGRAVGAGANSPAAGTENNGNAATAVTESAATIMNTAVQSGGQGGGAYHTPSFGVTNNGGMGGTAICAVSQAWPGAVPEIIRGVGLNDIRWAGGAGGGSGGQWAAGVAANIGTGRGGGGGGGGGVLAIYARCLVNLGRISANGGAGGTAALGTGTDCIVSGGGGGGGGAVLLVFGALGSTVGQVLTAGGSAGGGFAGVGGSGESASRPDYDVINFGGVSSAEYNPDGGTAGASATIGATMATFYAAMDATAGWNGLVWALPL